MSKPRRLVNFHRSGRYAGVYQIHGVEQHAPLTDAEMPTQVEVQMLDGTFRLCEMVGSTERAVVYAEVRS